MKMILEQFELEEAIAVYIEHKYFTLKGKHLEIEFMSGRSPPSVSANLNIVDDNPGVNAKTLAVPNIAKAVPIDDSPFLSDVEAPVPFSDKQADLPFG